ncbi:MAG: twin-arginine translocase subunit TatC [Planctomycetota bacterium]
MPLDQGHPELDEPLFPEGASKGKQDEPMPLGDHLEELRGCVIRALVGVFVIFFVMVLPPVAMRVIAWLARPLLSAMHEANYPPQTIVTDATAGFTTVYLPVSFISALIVASPWVLYQVWRFVAVGLYANERRAVHILVPFSTFMTALGVGFTYYVMLPVALMFFLSFAKLYPQVEPGEPGYVMSLLTGSFYGSDRPDPLTFEDPATAIIPALPVLSGDPDPLLDGMVWIDGPTGTLRTAVNGRVIVQTAAKPQLMTPLPKVDEYIRFAAYLGLGVVVAFQLPVLMLVTGWTGLIDPDWIAKGRKYALFVCVCLGGILTPTDLLSMAVLSVPLYGLFELGLILMRIAHRSRTDEAEPA